MVLDAAHGEGVVADDGAVVGEDPGGGGAGSRGDGGGSLQPLVEDRNAAVEAGAAVTLEVEQLGRRELHWGRVRSDLQGSGGAG